MQEAWNRRLLRVLYLNQQRDYKFKTCIALKMEDSEGNAQKAVLPKIANG